MTALLSIWLGGLLILFVVFFARSIVFGVQQRSPQEAQRVDGVHVGIVLFAWPYFVGRWGYRALAQRA